MRGNIIEELYYGNIDPQDRGYYPQRPVKKASDSLNDLEEKLSEQLALYGLERVMLDLSVVNDVDYYDDIVFRGFVEGAPSAVLSGGRYDKLLQRMGKTGGALGFAVYLDRLETMSAPRPDYDGDLLVCYETAADIPLAVQMAEAARANGETVRVQAQPPKGLRYRRVLRAEKGAVTEC